MYVLYMFSMLLYMFLRLSSRTKKKPKIASCAEVLLPQAAGGIVRRRWGCHEREEVEREEWVAGFL